MKETDYRSGGNDVSGQAGETGRSSILKNNYFLYLTEFFSGMSVMAVEKLWDTWEHPTP